MPTDERRLAEYEDDHDPTNLTCCCCFEERIFQGGFNGLCCSRYHKVCFPCLKKLIAFCDCERPDCFGVSWKCPLCRQRSALATPQQLIGIERGSWRAVCKIPTYDEKYEESSREELDAMFETQVNIHDDDLPD